MELNNSTAIITSHKQKLVSLEAKLAEAKTKQVMLKTRANAAKTQRQLQETIGEIDTSSAMGAFERMDDKVMQLEAESRSVAELGGMGLEEQFAQLEASSGIYDELEAMKAQLNNSSINLEPLPVGGTYIDPELEELRSQLNDEYEIPDIMNIRDATENDLAAIVEIYNSTISDRMATADTEPITVETRIPWLKNRDFNYRPVWVIETAEKQIVGWLSFNNFYGRPAYQHTAEISIYVAETHRRQGIGNQLLQKAIAQADRLQIKILLGFIFAHNQPSLNLFKNYGFQQWGLLPQVAKLDEREQDLVILGLKIG